MNQEILNKTIETVRPVIPVMLAIPVILIVLIFVGKVVCFLNPWQRMEKIEEKNQLERIANFDPPFVPEGEFEKKKRERRSMMEKDLFSYLNTQVSAQIYLLELKRFNKLSDEEKERLHEAYVVRNICESSAILDLEKLSTLVSLAHVGMLKSVNQRLWSGLRAINFEDKDWKEHAKFVIVETYSENFFTMLGEKQP